METSLEKNFKELSMLMKAQESDVKFLSKLVQSEVIKYIHRPVRDELLRRILNRLKDLDEATDSYIKKVREIRRQRFNDERQISNLMMNIALMGDVKKLIDEPPAMIDLMSYEDYLLATLKPIETLTTQLDDDDGDDNG